MPSLSALPRIPMPRLTTILNEDIAESSIPLLSLCIPDQNCSTPDSHEITDYKSIFEIWFRFHDAYFAIFILKIDNQVICM